MVVCVRAHVPRREIADGNAISGHGLDRILSYADGGEPRVLSAGSEPAPQEQAREQTQVHVGIPGSKGPFGLSTVSLAQDNVSEGGYDGTSRAGRACSARAWRQWFSAYQSVIACVSGSSGLCGLCGLALNGWRGWKLSGGVDDRQNCDRDGGRDGWRLVSFEPQRPIVTVAAGVVGHDVTIRSSVGRRGTETGR